MFIDQKQYLRYCQITSDLICFAILDLLFVPLILTLTANGWGDLFSVHADACNVCIYKTPFSLNCILILTVISTGILVRLKFYDHSSTNTKKVLLIQPVSLTIIHSTLLWMLLTWIDLDAHTMYTAIISSITFLFLLLLANRLYLVHAIRKSKSHAHLIRQIVLVGTGSNSLLLATYIKTHPESGLRLAGCLATRKNASHQQNFGFRILGIVTDLPSLVLEHHIDCILVPEDENSSPHLDYLFKTCAAMGIDFATAMPLPEPAPLSSEQYSMEILGKTKISLFQFTNTSPFSAFIRRVVDFTASTALIFLCLPFWIIVPALIHSSSPGPAFFRQKRVGKFGEIFTLYKFRSMIVNAEAMQSDLVYLNEMDGPAFKIKDDPRLTPTGKFLRKYSLDELPQLFNVFLGDISLVGPRPAKADEVRQYKPTERRRLSVIQGITCIWQVSGRNDLKFDEWMKLDLLYIDNRSIMLDLKILLRTVPAVLMKKGAY